METVIKRASKLLGDCKAGNILKELKKFKQEDKLEIEAYNKKLGLQVNDLLMALKVKDKEIWQLRARVESLEKIWEVVGTLGDVLNKGRLFDNNVKTRGEVSVAKIIRVLVSFMMKIETTLGEMQKLLSGSLAAGSSQAPPPPPKEVLQVQKEFEEMKARIQQRTTKELIEEVAKIKIPRVEVPVWENEKVDFKWVLENYGRYILFPLFFLLRRVKSVEVRRDTKRR